MRMQGYAHQLVDLWRPLDRHLAKDQVDVMWKLGWSRMLQRTVIWLIMLLLQRGLVCIVQSYGQEEEEL